MALSILEKIEAGYTHWLIAEREPPLLPLCDFDRIQYELRPCDVILIEGRSRISDIIKMITQSAWSHAALYIGRLHDIQNPVLRKRVQEFYDGAPEDQLIIESFLGAGTVISNLANYRQDHLRICRPKGISRTDAQHVIDFAIGRLGNKYAVRHILDLARFLLPWSIIPRRWRSSLFQHNPGVATKEICSVMIAEAFQAVHFPILPMTKYLGKAGLKLYRRNPKLTTPSDFDYSPYFEIIKYPFFKLGGHASYRELPWNEQGLYSDEHIEPVEPSKKKNKTTDKKNNDKNAKTTPVTSHEASNDAENNSNEHKSQH